MLQWIGDNLSTILICIFLLAIVILIIRSLIRQKKQGKSSCGAGCAHCAMHGECHKGHCAQRGETRRNTRLPRTFPGRLDMPNQEKPLTPSAIGYLLILSEFCRDGRGARCIDVAARMNVSKPSAHAMIRNLCEMQLAEKERYGIVYLTQAGRKAAALYETCYEPLFARIQDILALDGDACRRVVLAVLAQVPDRLEELSRRLA